VTGDDYVIYRAGTNASARVHGEVSHVTRGETAELYAQPFPDRHAHQGRGGRARPEVR